MITTTPFPLIDLADNRTGKASQKTGDHDQDQSDPKASGQRRPMTSDVFGADGGKTSEPDRIYTADDLARAVEDARRAASTESEAALRASMADDMEQRRCDVLSAIRERLEQSEAAFEEELARMSAVSQRLAIALARAIIPRTIESQPLADITDALKMTLKGLVTMPAIELRLHPSHVAFGEALLDDLSKDAGFAGELTTVADAALGEGDAELRWHGGVLCRRLKNLQTEAFELADRWLEQLPEDGGKDAFRPPLPTHEPESAGDQSGPAHDTEAKNERTIQ